METSPEFPIHFLKIYIWTSTPSDFSHLRSKASNRETTEKIPTGPVQRTCGHAKPRDLVKPEFKSLARKAEHQCPSHPSLTNSSPVDDASLSRVPLLRRQLDVLQVGIKARDIPR